MTQLTHERTIFEFATASATLALPQMQPAEEKKTTNNMLESLSIAPW